MFSIVIPLYNKEKQIAKTLESVFNQTFQEYEIIIVNDGSTDNSVEIVKQIDDKRIKLINQPNGGVSSARNTGIKNASFEYIAFLDADDEWMDDYLETIFNMINQYPECDIFATNYKIVEKGKVTYPVNVNIVKYYKTVNKESGILNNYFEFASNTAPPLCSSAIVCTKKSLKSVNFFPLGISSGEDLLTWFKLAINYKIAYSKSINSIYHNEIQNWEAGRNVDIIDFVGIELEKAFKSKGNLENKDSIKIYISLWYKMRASTFIRHNLKILALKEIYKSLKMNPRNYKIYLYFIILFSPKILHKIIFK